MCDAAVLVILVFGFYTGRAIQLNPRSSLERWELGIRKDLKLALGACHDQNSTKCIKH